MNYLEFQNTLRPFHVFSTKDIENFFPGYRQRALHEWQEKGYILKIRNKYYCFGDFDRSELFLFLVANKIYSPSYISLESALSYYGIIPEAVITITSVSTLKTESFKTPLGQFSYRNFKPSLFFGYRLLTYNNRKIRMADFEKALLDYVYLNPEMNSSEAFEGMRFNRLIIRETLRHDKLQQYLTLYTSKRLISRMHTFLKWIK